MSNHSLSNALHKQLPIRTLGLLVRQERILLNFSCLQSEDGFSQIAFAQSNNLSGHIFGQSQSVLCADLVEDFGDLQYKWVEMSIIFNIDQQILIKHTSSSVGDGILTNRHRDLSGAIIFDESLQHKITRHPTLYFSMVRL